VPVPAGAQVAPPRFGDAELDAVLARYNQCWTPRDDLADLLHEAELLSYRNRLGGLRCATSCPAPSSPSSSARRWPRPVRCSSTASRRCRWWTGVQRIVGIVTRADFMRAAQGQRREGLSGRLQALLQAFAGHAFDQARGGGQIMSRQVRVASADRPIAGLVPLFSDTGHHHIPIVGEQARLVGILTQSDLVKALSHGP
jgi:CBS domain-containing membrane protein